MVNGLSCAFCVPRPLAVKRREPLLAQLPRRYPHLLALARLEAPPQLARYSKTRVALHLRRVLAHLGLPGKTRSFKPHWHAECFVLIIDSRGSARIIVDKPVTVLFGRNHGIV